MLINISGLKSSLHRHNTDRRSIGLYLIYMGRVVQSVYFPPVQTGPGAHPASCTMGTRLFPGAKVRPGRAADHSPPSSAAVMEE